MPRVGRILVGCPDFGQNTLSWWNDFASVVQDQIYGDVLCRDLHNANHRAAYQSIQHLNFENLHRCYGSASILTDIRNYEWRIGGLQDETRPNCVQYEMVSWRLPSTCVPRM